MNEVRIPGPTIEPQQPLLDTLDMACEEAEERVNFRFYKNLEEYSGLLALLIFTVGLLLFKYVAIEVLITIGIAWALVGMIHLKLSKIAQNKFMHLKNHVCSTMEELFGQIWQAYKEKCVDKLYEKYIRKTP